TGWAAGPGRSTTDPLTRFRRTEGRSPDRPFSFLLVLDEARSQDAVRVEALLGGAHPLPLVAVVIGPSLRRVEGDVAGEVALAAVMDRQLAGHVEVGQGALQVLLGHAREDAPAHHVLALGVHEERHVRAGGAGRPEEHVTARSQ